MDRKLQHLIDIILVLTQKEIKIRYKSSLLGYVWSVAHPLAFALVFFIAFGVIMKIQMENYALFLIAGLFPWQWMANSIGASPLVLWSNSPLIKKMNFPRNSIPFALVLQETFHYLMSIPVIVFFLFLYGQTPSWSWLWGIPFLLVTQYAMTYGLSLFLASVNLFFRDLERLTGIFMTFLFYFTPIIYPEKMVPANYKAFLDLNPFSPLMISWRNLFLSGTWDSSYLFLSLLYALLALILGQLTYKKLCWKFAEVL